MHVAFGKGDLISKVVRFAEHAITEGNQHTHRGYQFLLQSHEMNEQSIREDVSRVGSRESKRDRFILGHSNTKSESLDDAFRGAVGTRLP